MARPAHALFHCGCVIGCDAGDQDASARRHNPLGDGHHLLRRLAGAKNYLRTSRPQFPMQVNGRETQIRHRRRLKGMQDRLPAGFAALEAVEKLGG